MIVGSNDYPKWEYISGAIPDLEVPHSSKIEDDDIVYTDWLIQC